MNLILPKKDKEYGNIIVLVIRSYEKPDIKKVEKVVSSLSGLLKPREVFWHSNKGINAKLSANYYAEFLSGSDFDPGENYIGYDGKTLVIIGGGAGFLLLLMQSLKDLI